MFMGIFNVSITFFEGCIIMTMFDLRVGKNQMLAQDYSEQSCKVESARARCGGKEGNT
jgi:hypothetical protein